MAKEKVSSRKRWFPKEKMGSGKDAASRWKGAREKTIPQGDMKTIPQGEMGQAQDVAWGLHVLWGENGCMGFIEEGMGLERRWVHGFHRRGNEPGKKTFPGKILGQGEDGPKDDLVLRKRWSSGVEGRELKGWAGGNKIGLGGTKVGWVLAGKLEEAVNGVQPSLVNQGKPGKQRGLHSRLGHQSPQPWLLRHVADRVVFNLLLLFHVCHVFFGMKMKSLCPAHNCLLDLELHLGLGNQSSQLWLDYFLTANLFLGATEM
jgi:hypothetical protein